MNLPLLRSQAPVFHRLVLERGFSAAGGGARDWRDEEEEYGRAEQDGQEEEDEEEPEEDGGGRTQETAKKADARYQGAIEAATKRPRAPSPADAFLARGL